MRLNLLSTVSKVACPSSPFISSDQAAVIHPRFVRRPCHIKGCLDVHAMYIVGLLSLPCQQLFRLSFFFRARCNVICDDTGKTERERVTKKKRTSEGSNDLAGTDESSGHLVMRKAWIPKSEWPPNVKKRLPCANGRTH